VDLSRLKFTKTHEWILIEGKKATIGVTDYAQREMTDIVYVELPKVSQQVEAKQECTTLESVKSVFSVYAPVSGKIIEVNEMVVSDPSRINSSPYEDGWLWKMDIKDEKESSSLMNLEQYNDFIHTEGQ
jgi:glycine cleavage system H protein